MIDKLRIFYKLFFLLLIPWILFQSLTSFGQQSNPRLFIISVIDSLNDRAENFIGTQIDSLVLPASDAYNLSKQINYRDGIEKAKYLLALHEAALEKYSSSLDLLFHYLEFAQTQGDLTAQVKTYVRISQIYLEINNFDRSLVYCQSALESARKSKKYQDLSGAYEGLANYYYRIKSSEKALEIADSSLDYCYLSNNKTSMARLEKLYGDIYIETGNLIYSLIHYKRALSAFISINNLTEEAIVITRIAHLCQLQKRFHDALTFSRRALEIRLRQKNKEFISHSFINLGNSFQLVGKTDSALICFKKGLEIANSSHNQRAIVYALSRLYTYYKDQHEFRDALNYMELYSQARINLQSGKSNSEINSIEIKYLEKEKENQIKILQKENEIHRLDLQNRSYYELINQLIIGITGVLIFFLVYLAERNKLGKSKLEVINKQLDLEIQEHKATEVQLRRSEHLYRFVTDHMLDLIVRMDHRLSYLFISPSILRMFQYDPKEPLQNLPRLSKVINPEYRKELIAQYREMVHSKKPMMATFQGIRKDGSTFWAESLVNPIFHETTERLDGTITVVRDISDRVAYEEVLSENANQKELLLREIHHRVKNNFSILIGLMNMEARSTGTGAFRDFLNDLHGRIRTMALVHELLYNSEDMDYIELSAYLKQLISILSYTFNNPDITVNTRFDPCLLGVEIAMPLGLIVNEILTNAFKYAFLSRKEGQLWIDLRLLDGNQEHPPPYTHSLTIRDNGKGLPDDFSFESQKTMGSQIIYLLIGQIAGNLSYSNNHGASFTILFRDEKIE